MADLCDFAYALLLEDVDAMSVAAASAGAPDAGLAEGRERLGQWLARPVWDDVRRLSVEERDLRRALGLRG